MIYVKDHKQGYLLDPWDYLGPKRRLLMEQSWAGLFREEILNNLPVWEFAKHYDRSNGRPTKELYTALGIQILQHMNELTDEETIEQLAFNTKWHFALDIPDESDEAKYMSLKTLWNIRQVIIENGIDTQMFNQTTDTLARAFSVDTSCQRLDSVHIRSNMKRLGRIGIFVRSIHRFLVNLKRQHEEIFASLPQELVEKYLTKKSLSCFSMVKPSESERTLKTVSADLFDLIQRFGEHPEVMTMSTFSLLLRVLEEQCLVTKTPEGNPVEVAVKPAKEVSSDSLQNPSDPDATYDGHKGQGYQVQVMETYCDTEETEVRETTLNLITHIELETACKSDAHALIPAIESTENRGLAPDEVLADSLYGSDENLAVARELGVNVISPVMGTPKKDAVGLAEFSFSDSGKVIACPQGHAPVTTTHKKGRHTAAFDHDHCNACPLKAICPVKDGKKYCYLNYDDKARRIAVRRAEEDTDEFKEKYRWRSGIEATMSEYDKKTGVKQLRVRGFGAVQFCVLLKAIGINLFRATAVRKAMKTFPGFPNNAKLVLDGFVLALKELFAAIFLLLEQFCIFPPRYYAYEAKSTG
jgi:hypothetical protein